MQFVVLLLGILLLLFLIIRVKLNTFVSLIVTSILVALGLGMNPANIADAIKNGIGSSMGELVIVFGFGAMIGRLVSDAGGAYRIARTLINVFGKKRLQVAVVIASFLIGISLLFEVGLVLVTPIVFAVALEADVPFLYLGISMAAALSATQGFLPPQPSPTAVATALGANIGEMLIVGIIVAIPCVIVAGPIWTRVVRKFNPDLFVVKKSLPAFGEIKQFKLEETPGFGLSILTSLFPVIFMILATIYELTVEGGKTPDKSARAKCGCFDVGQPCGGHGDCVTLCHLVYGVSSSTEHEANQCHAGRIC